MKQILIFLFTATIVYGSAFTNSYAEDKPKIQWVSFDQAVELSKKEPRKILIDIYTDWCGWCKKMDAATYSHPKIVEYINKHFYAVKYNAESKDTIRFNNHVFTYKKDYRCNEFAFSLLSGKMSYPSTVWLAEDFTMLSPVGGYLQPSLMEKILTYYGENHHNKTAWAEYEKQFVGEIKE